MIRKILLNNATYILTAALLILVGQFLYLDAFNRVAASNEEKSQTLVEEAEEPSLFSLYIDEDIANTQAAITISAPILEDAIAESPSKEEVVEEISQLNTPEEPIEKVEETANEDTNAEVIQTVPSTPQIELPYTQTLFIPGGEWGLGYGTLFLMIDHLQIGGGKENTASLVLLDGGYDLEDYTFTTHFDWNRGTSYALVARFHNYENFVTCSYVDYGARVSIISQVNGERITHNSSPSLKTKSIESWKDLSFGIRVFNGVVECLKEGEVVLRNTLSDTPDKGTVGIAIWAKNPGEALVSINKIEVNK